MSEHIKATYVGNRRRGQRELLSRVIALEQWRESIAKASGGEVAK